LPQRSQPLRLRLLLRSLPLKSQPLRLSPPLKLKRLKKKTARRHSDATPGT
jgi:hypothetical protein